MSRPAPLAVVAGGLAQRRKASGHAWVFVNWLLGLRSLGFSVLFLDRLEPSTLSEPTGQVERSAEWAWLSQVMNSSGLGGCFAALTDGEPLGTDRDRLVHSMRNTAVLFNVMGFVRDPDLLSLVPGQKVFVDIDPGFPQMWSELGLADLLEGHDAYATVGLTVGSSSSKVPTCGREWLPIPPPVALDAWPNVQLRPTYERSGTRATSVATWRGLFGPVEFEGATYGLRVHEHRALSELPARIDEVDFELLLDIDPSDAADAARLASGGWVLRDPRQTVPGLREYQKYLQTSDLEFATAKAMYVKSRGGWFSDRSACYLASGRPVVGQETGFSERLPTGAGLHSFNDMDEAERCVRAVTDDLDRQSDAARRLAEEHLDARRVIGSLLRRIGTGTPDSARGGRAA